MLAIQATTRSTFGKQLSEVRSAGNLPAIVYGPKLKTALPISISLKEFSRVFHEAGESTLIELAVEGSTKRKVLIHGIDRDPVKHTPRHVDFYEVDISKPIRVHVHLKFVGEAPAEKVLGGVLVKTMHEIEIEALPDALPHEIEVDISSLATFTDHITIGSISMPKGVNATADESHMVALVEPPKTEEQLQAETSGDTAIDFDAIQDAVEKPPKEEEEADKSADEE